MRPALRLALFVGLVSFATPAMASDPTELRVLLLGAYLVVAVPLFGIVWVLCRSRSDTRLRSRLPAFAFAGLFAPTLMSGPNYFWPTGLLLVLQWYEYIGWPTLLSFALTTSVVWLAVTRADRLAKRREP